MHLFEEYDITPGTRRIRVVLMRIDSAASSMPTSDSAAAPSDTLLGGREGREAEERMRRAREAIPAALVLDTALSLAPQRVLLITYDGGTRRLVARTEP
jgi:hypothetical protein